MHIAKLIQLRFGDGAPAITGILLVLSASLLALGLGLLLLLGT